MAEHFNCKKALQLATSKWEERRILKYVNLDSIVSFSVKRRLPKERSAVWIYVTVSRAVKNGVEYFFCVKIKKNNYKAICAYTEAELAGFIETLFTFEN